MPSGKMVQSRGKDYSSYIPDPLPPKIEWDASLINALSNADRLLGYLAGEGGQLPNPHILVRPFMAREAVLSSRIEGTQATLGDILAARAGAAHDNVNVDDVKEVNNYIIALEYGMKRIKDMPLSLRLLKELHAKLMTNVRGDHAVPGEFRRSQNWIGPAHCTLMTATYVPPAPEYLMSCLAELELFMHDTTLPPLVQIAVIHYQFEAIHPFLDGNGRVGRLLITLFLIERKVLPVPLLYLSAFFEVTRKEYYKRLLEVTRKGAWNAWLHYFLTGVAQQAEDAISRVKRINHLLETWRKQTAGVSHQLIDKLASNPFITINKTAELMNVSYTTIQRSIAKLEALGILQETSGSKRNRVYCSKALLSILDEPANI